MSYFIILMVLSMVLGPLFWVAPSPRVKRQMKLRDHAMACGFQVKICDLPQSHRARVRKEPAEEGAVYRMHHMDPKERSTINAAAILCLRSDEEGDDARLAHLQAFLTQSPEDVVAIEVNTLGYGVYWGERGGVEDVDNIKMLLENLDRQLRERSLI